MTAAAFKAEYSDFKLIRTRKTVQVIFEVPVEQSNDVLKALGGMPNPGTSVWCAIARLNNEGVAQTADARPGAPATEHAGSSPAPLTTNDKPSTSWHQLSAAQQAGILCGEPAFHQYLSEALPNYWEKARVTGEDPYLQHRAAQTIRDICGVKSRRDIDAQAETTWSELVADYRAWMRQPEVVG